MQMRYQISSIDSEHVAKTKTYQPKENENVNSIQLKHESITINEMTVGPLIDTGSSIDIIDLMEFAFDGIQSKGQKIRLFKTNEKLYPYAAVPIKMLSYFESLIENENRYTTAKLYVVKNGCLSYPAASPHIRTSVPGPHKIFNQLNLPLLIVQSL